MESQPPAASWQLVFSGECLDGHDPAEVRRAVVRFLKLDEARAARLFSGKRIVLRRDVGMAAAQRTIRIYAVMGAALYAEPSKLQRDRKSPAPTPAPTAPPAATVAPPVHAPAAWAWRSVAALGAVGAGAALGLMLVWALVGPVPGPRGPVLSAGAGTVAPPASRPALEPAAQGQQGAPDPAASTNATAAELPADMPADARLHYLQRYATQPGHKAFALSAGGVFASHAGEASANDAAERAIASCMAALRPGDAGCRLLDLDGQLLE